MEQKYKDQMVVEGFLSSNGVGDARKQYTRDLFTVDGKHVSDIPEWAVAALATAIRNAERDERARCNEKAQTWFNSLVQDIVIPLYDVKKMAADLIERVEKKKGVEQ